VNGLYSAVTLLIDKNVIKSMKHTVLKVVIAFALMTSILACNQQIDKPSNIQTPQVNENNIKAHIAFLADDTLKGRDTGSEGYQIAANYVKSHFKQYGLLPRGEHGSYEQIVPFRKSFLAENGAELVLHSSSGDHKLSHAKQFISRGSSVSTSSNISADAVFVGYGVINKRFGLDDYAGLDVKGKIVVMLSGRPEGLPSEEGAHIGSSREKARHAVERGAVGIISIHTPKREKVRKFEVSARYAQGPSYRWLNKQGFPFDSHPEIKGAAYIDIQAASPLFEGAELSLSEVFSLDNDNKAIKGFPLLTKVSMVNKSLHEEVKSPNIIGVIEGSDPTLKHEYVLFSAHLDHIGVREHQEHDGSINDDTINNGALDNASGVAVLLETARMLSLLETKPKRSILFVVVTGEEKGLLGSSYFAQNPTVPATQMVANVNLDMPLILYPFADVIAFGSTHSSLGDIVASAAEKVDISLSADPMPEQALFTRSDHYSFVKIGVPSVFLMTGFQSKDPAIDGGKMFKEFLSKHYHNHSDQIDLPIRYDAAASFAEVNMMIGIEIANQVNRPTWHNNDFFGETFAQ